MKKVFLFMVLIAIAMMVTAQTTIPDPEPKMNIWQIISGILLVAGMFFASTVSKLRAKIVQAMLVLKEAIELVEYVVQASPGGFDDTEQARIIKEAQDVRTAWRTLIGKAV